MMYLGNNPVGVNQVLLMNEIDDTAGIGDTNKTYSADKISRDLNSKLSAPSSTGSVGQVLTSDGENGQNWTNIIDNTLTESGMAADAAATGALKSILNDIATNRVESAQMIDPTKYVAGYMWNNGWDGDNYVGSTIDADPVEDSFWTIVNQKWFLGEDKVIGFNYKTPNIQILCYTYDPQLEDYALYTTRTANNCTTDGDHYQLTLSDEIDAIRIFVASEWLSGLTDPIIMAMNADWDGISTYGSSPASIRSDIQIAQVNSLRTELMSALNAISDEKMDKPSSAGTSGQVLVSDGNGGQAWGTTGTGTITIDSSLTVSGAAADAAAVGGSRIEIPASSIPWEIGGIANEGLTDGWTRGRMGVTIRTVSPVTIVTTSDLVSYVYDLTGSRLDDESNKSWSKTTRTIKANRLFRLATRNSNDSTVSLSDLSTLVSGIKFITCDLGKVDDQISANNGFDYALINTLKQMAYSTESGLASLNALAETMKETTTVYNFEPHCIPSRIVGGSYLTKNVKKMTTQARYFPADSNHSYKVKANLNTSAKAWIALRFLNATAVQAIDTEDSYTTSDYTDGDFAEMVNGEYTFTPSGQINGEDIAGVAITLGFGTTAAANDISAMGTEISSLTIQRTVIVDG